MVEVISRQRIALEKKGIVEPRVCFTHAVAPSVFAIVAEIFGFEHDGKVLCDWIIELAKNKQESAYNDSQLAEEFLSAFESLKGAHENGINDREHFIEDHEYYYIRLGEALKIMNINRYPFTNSPLLRDELRRHQRFFKANMNKKGDWEKGGRIQRFGFSKNNQKVGKGV